MKEEISAQKNDFEVADYFKRGYNNMLGKVRKMSPQRGSKIISHKIIKNRDMVMTIITSCIDLVGLLMIIPSVHINQ